MIADADERRAEHRVEEVQGLYGTFTFSEHLLQQIWARREYDGSNLVTQDGRRVEVVYPGRWNTLGGPDFKEARIRLDGGAVQSGDVELHLHASGWRLHGHAADPAYDRVLLHVVLFPETESPSPEGADARLLPTLALLPHLHHSLEEYAAESAIECLAGRPMPAIMERLRERTPEDLSDLLQGRARERWQQKVRYAALRLERLGWIEACHHAALEALGYRFNRAPMLELAVRYPLDTWAGRGVDLREAHAAVGDQWTRHGVRPANHPWVRLQQYAAWVEARPNWPGDLAALVPQLPHFSWGTETGVERRVHRLASLRADLAQRICGGRVGGHRFDNLVCDGWLPLAAAYTGRDVSGLWWHWWPGDQPPMALRVLRELGVFSGALRPAAHGPMQGLLAQILAAGVR